MYSNNFMMFSEYVNISKGLNSEGRWDIRKKLFPKFLDMRVDPKFIDIFFTELFPTDGRLTKAAR